MKKFRSYYWPIVLAMPILLGGCYISWPGVTVSAPGVAIEPLPAPVWGEIYAGPALAVGVAPVPIIEVQPICPTVGFVWVDGYWCFNEGHWRWRRGCWLEPHLAEHWRVERHEFEHGDFSRRHERERMESHRGREGDHREMRHEERDMRHEEHRATEQPRQEQHAQPQHQSKPSQQHSSDKGKKDDKKGKDHH